MEGFFEEEMNCFEIIILMKMCQMGLVSDDVVFFISLFFFFNFYNVVLAL